MNTLLEKYSYIIFDFDETIAKLQIDWSEWSSGTTKVINEFNSSYSIEKTHYSDINDQLKIYGDPLREKVYTFLEKYELQHLQGIIPNPKVVELLEDLSTKLPLFLLTSNTRKTIEKVFSVLHIEPFFAKVFTCNDTQFFKPNPWAFSQIYVKDTHLSEYLMIGDSANDSGFAKNVGIDFLHVSEI